MSFLLHLIISFFVQCPSFCSQLWAEEPKTSFKKSSCESLQSLQVWRRLPWFDL